MNDKAFSNDLNTRIKVVVQHVMHNLVSSDLFANTISSSIFKLEEIRYYDFELNIQYDEKNIIIIKIFFYIWDMYFFINWIKSAAAIKKADQIKIQLFEALKKIALK